MIKSSVGFGEPNSQTRENNNEESKKLATNIVTNSESNKGKREKIYQQYERMEARGAFTSRSSFTPSDDSGRIQRSQNPFPPLMDDIKCFNCHNFGHVANTYKRIMYKSMNQFDQTRRGSSFDHTLSFNMSNRISDPFSPYLVHVECYMCHNFVHMGKYFKLTRLFKPSGKEEDSEESVKQREQPRTMSTEKKKQLGKCGISLYSDDQNDSWYIDKRSSHNMS